MDIKYAIVIPAKNEELTIAETLESVARQTHRPELCIVVDDGSEDKTAGIIQDFSKKHGFIKYLKHDKPKKTYSLGGHVVEVFTYGVKHLYEEGYNPDFIMKMDSDLSFEPDCLETLLSRTKNEKLGIFSGTPYYIHNNKKIIDVGPLWHSHGQLKIYNAECLKQIGGIPLSVGWDGGDNIKAMYRGWKTMAYRDVLYKMHRKVGGKSSLKKGRINHGIGSYVLGYSFLYFILKVLHDIVRPPFVVGSIYMVYGYFKAIFERREKILNKGERKLLRKLYWESFFERSKSGELVLFQFFKFKKSNT